MCYNRGATLMFNCAAGYYTGDRAGLDNVRAFIGFSCAQDGLSADGSSPTLFITDADAEKLAEENGRARLVRRERPVMNCLSRITRCQLRGIAERANCRLIGETGALYADIDCVRTDGAKALLLVRERKD